MSSPLGRAVRRNLGRPPGYRPIPPAGTLAVCALTAAAFVGQSLDGDGRWIRAAGALYTSPYHFFPVTRVGDGQAVPVWLSLFTYVFLHGGWWHLVSNLAAVWWVGTVTEPAWGTVRFLAAYLACGVVGALGVGVVYPHSLHPAFGASLAYGGVLGAYLALRLPARRQILVVAAEVAAVLLVGAWLGFREHRAAWEGPIVYHLLPFMAGWLAARVTRTRPGVTGGTTG